jgi:hypothetical protein
MNYDRIRPIFIPIRPPIGGLNVSQPPQTIGNTASPELSNTRFVGGQLQSRPGFAVKYPGVPEPVFFLHPFYNADGTFQALVAFGKTKVWQFHTDTVFKPIILWDNATPEVYATLTTLVAEAYYSVAVGSGQYVPHKINAAAQYPTSGYENILAFTNGNDGVYVIFPGSDGDPLTGELVDDSDTNGFTGAVAVTFFANRLIVFGTTNNPSEITFSTAGVFSDFAGVGSGTAVLSDDADRIQAALLMREFLVVYKERSIYIGRATGFSDSPISFEKGPGGNIGTIAPMSVVGSADRHFFLGIDNVYELSPDNGLKPIGDPIKEELFGRTGSRGIDPKYAIRALGAIVKEYGEYWLFTSSGNVPEATNIVPGGDMTMVFFTADTNNLSKNITSVPAAVFPLLRRLEGIDDNAGADEIPASTLVESYNSVTQTIVMDKAATGTHTKALAANNGANWFLISITGNDTVTTVPGGNLGGVFQRITLATTPYAIFGFNTATSITSIGTGATISCLMWLRANATATCRIQLHEYTSAGVFIETHTKNLTLAASTEFQPHIFSFTSANATFRKIKASIVFDTGTTLDVDAMQVVNMTDIDPRFWYRDNDGYVAPGLLRSSSSNEVTLIPYIAGSIGPWSTDTLWVYNYKNEAWSVWKLLANCTTTDTIQATSVLISDLVGTIDQQSWRFDTQEFTTLSPSNLLGSSEGQVFETSRKYQFDRQGFLNDPILAYWQSKDFDLDAPNQDKTISRVTLFHERSHPPTEVQVGVSTDSGNTWTQQTITMRTGFTETFADFFVTGSQVRFEVRCESPGFYLTGFSLKLIPRGETNAY